MMEMMSRHGTQGSPSQLPKFRSTTLRVEGVLSRYIQASTHDLYISTFGLQVHGCIQLPISVSSLSEASDTIAMLEQGDLIL